MDLRENTCLSASIEIERKRQKSVINRQPEYGIHHKLCLLHKSINNGVPVKVGYRRAKKNSLVPHGRLGSGIILFFQSIWQHQALSGPEMARLLYNFASNLNPRFFSVIQISMTVFDFSPDLCKTIIEIIEKSKMLQIL